MTNTNIKPWAYFVTVGNSTTVRHFTTRARARLAAAIAQQKNPLAVTKIRRANRQNAKKLYMLVKLTEARAIVNDGKPARYTLEVLRTEVAPAPVKAKPTTRRSAKVETLTFAFM